MKKYLGSSAMVLGMFAAGLVACGDEGASTNNTGETKSAITARGFKSAGCTGAGVFDISSNNVINFVALDNSSFSSLDASLYALDENNQESLITSTQNSNQIDQAMTSLLDQVSNFTSASQRAEQLAQQAASSTNSARSTTTLDQSEVASTFNTTNSQRDVNHSDYLNTRASGFNNTRSSRDANSWANSGNQASSSNSANSEQSAAAINAAANAANSARNSGASSSLSNAANAAATNSALNSGSAFSVVANDISGKAGWGKGGFGFNDISNLNSFSNNVFNDVRSSRFNNQRSDVNNSQFANLYDNQFSKVFSNARRSSANNVNSANNVSSQSNLHDDVSTATSYDRGNTVANQMSTHDAVSTSNSATTRNDLSRRIDSSTLNSIDSASRAESLAASEAQAANKSFNKANSQTSAQRYSALSNLSQFNAKQLVLKLNVTANSQNAIVRVFTGNNANSVASNSDFNQVFAGCGTGAGIIGPKTLPLVAPAAEQAEAAQLGDRVAKPENE